MSDDDETLPVGEYFDRTIGLHATADGGFPYPYGSDLHWLWGWGERIDTWLLDGKPPNRYLPGIFRPDRLADAAITRLSDRFPQAFGLIAVDLREVERCFEAQDDSEGKRTELAEAMAKLRDRIWDTARLVADAFDEAVPKAEVDAKAAGTEDEEAQQPPALTRADRTTLLALGTFDASILASATEVAGAIPPKQRLAEKTVRLAIKKLVKLDLAERPEGEKQGARLTIRGRRLASKIAD